LVLRIIQFNSAKPLRRVRLAEDRIHIFQMADTNTVESKDSNCMAQLPEVQSGHDAVVEQPCRDLEPPSDDGCCNRQERDWSEVVVRIRNSDPSGMEELYQVLSKGIRFFLYRQLGPRDLDDKVHDLFVIVAQAIQRGELRHPARLMGFVRTVIRRQVAGHIETAVKERRSHTDLEGTLVLADHHPDPEHGAIEHENDEVARRVLKSINKRDREVLIRFYLNAEGPETICREMRLTETQFRLIKSRAKARYTALCRARFKIPVRRAAGTIPAQDLDQLLSA
jgi:RNA polymerase sigma-70 factor, ECF subfamily